MSEKPKAQERKNSMPRLLVLLLAAVLATMAFGDDGAITDRVRQRLFSDPDVKGHTVNVDTRDGVVTLNGTVETEKGRIKAEKLTKKVSGVKKVVNNLRVETLKPRS